MQSTIARGYVVRYNSALSYYNRATHMTKSNPAAKLAKAPGKPLSLRLTAEQRELIERGAKDVGQPSASAFMKAAAIAAAKGQDSARELAAIEQRVAATFESHTKRLRALENSTQMQLALLDGLAKVMLTCLPEPAPEAINAARARAKVRYEKLMRSVASEMTGDVASVVNEVAEASNRGTGA
jgi:uncharacterized protein (DUF1778 family)